MPKNKLIDKLKNDRGARAMAVTVAVMMLVLVAIIVVTVVANRTVQQEPLPRIDTTPAAVTDLTDDETDLATVTPPQSEQPEETNALPEHFLLPVHGVLQKGHSADVQVFSATMNDYRVHLGIDIGTVAGATVCAMADGTVAEIWDSVTLGHCVAVQHGGDACTVYKNLAPEDPAGIVVGAAVKAGDPIGTVGESAMTEIADEPHLHLEMTIAGVQVDPTEYLDQAAVAILHETANYEDES